MWIRFDDKSGLVLLNPDTGACFSLYSDAEEIEYMGSDGDVSQEFESHSEAVNAFVQLSNKLTRLP